MAVPAMQARPGPFLVLVHVRSFTERTSTAGRASRALFAFLGGRGRQVVRAAYESSAAQHPEGVLYADAQLRRARLDHRVAMVRWARSGVPGAAWLAVGFRIVHGPAAAMPRSEWRPSVSSP